MYRLSGDRSIVTPHARTLVIKASKAELYYVLPGFATLTESFQALGAGADGLRAFPAEAASPFVLKVLRVVLLGKTLMFPLGGITPDQIGGHCVAGAYGFGFGSNLYKIGKRLGENEAVAILFVRVITEFKVLFHSDVNELAIHENY